MKSAISRRRLLQGVAAAPVLAGLSPFLPSDIVRAADPPKRLLTIFHPMGYLESSFWPTMTSAGLQLDPNLAVLEPWKNKLIFPDGLLLGAGDGNSHSAGIASVFTGSKQRGKYPSNASYDFNIAEHLYAQEKTPHKYLSLGVNSDNNDFEGNHAFYTGPNQYVVKDNNAASVFETVFSRLPNSGMVDQAAIARARAQKQSIIDLVKADLDRVCKRVGAQERLKCEAHLDAIRRMETNLAQAEVKRSCTKPGAPMGGDLARRIDDQFDMIAAAFACDQARVISLTLGNANGGMDEVPGINHHDTTHAVGDRPNDPKPIEDHKRIDQFFASRWAQLFKTLDGYKEGNGSLLDNTLIVISSDTTTSITSGVRGAHSFVRMPFIVAGGSNFAFRTGRAIRVDELNGPQARTHHRLLVSISRAFGLNADKVGDNDPASGPLAGLV